MNGKTQRMLDDLVASDAPLVVVVAHSPAFAVELRERTGRLLGDATEIVSRMEIVRSDGRRILFMTAGAHVEERLRGLDPRPPVYTDHHALSLGLHP